MRTLLLGILLTVAVVGCDKSGSGGSAATVTLGAGAAPTVGASWDEEELTLLDLQLDMDGKQVPMKQEKTESKKVEILAVSGNVVTRARHTYRTVTEVQSLGGERREKPSPIAGKTYTLEVGSPTVVTTETGPAPEDEAAAVRKAERRFGKPDQMHQLLAGKTFRQGETVVLPPDQVLAAMQDDPDDKINAVTMSLTYRGMDGANARFDVAMTMKGEDDRGNQIELDFKGPGLVDPRSGEAMLLDLAGPFKMQGGMKATGTMRKSGKRTN